MVEDSSMIYCGTNEAC